MQRRSEASWDLTCTHFYFLFYFILLLFNQTRVMSSMSASEQRSFVCFCFHGGVLTLHLFYILSFILFSFYFWLLNLDQIPSPSSDKTRGERLSVLTDLPWVYQRTSCNKELCVIRLSGPSQWMSDFFMSVICSSPFPTETLSYTASLFFSSVSVASLDPCQIVTSSTFCRSFFY